MKRAALVAGVSFAALLLAGSARVQAAANPETWWANSRTVTTSGPPAWRSLKARSRASEKAEGKAGRFADKSPPIPSGPLHIIVSIDKQRATLFANGQPVFSDMWVGSLTKRPQFAVEIPVMRDGQVIYSLGMNVPAERFRALLETQDFPADMLVAVADSSGHVLARHPHLDEFIGRLARPELLAAMKTAGHGLVRLLSFDGIPQTVAYRRSELSGWVVGVGRADAALLADARRWLVWMLAGAVALSLAGIVLAVRIGGRTARSIKALVAPAQSLGRGEYADIPALDLEETHEVGEALSAASRVLCRQREALAGNAALLERQNDELRIAATAFASQQPIMVTDGDGLILRTNPAFSTTTGYSAGEAVGRRMSLLEADQAGLPGHGAYWPAVQRDGRWQGEMLYRRAGGDTYMAWLSVSAVRRPDGAISNVVGIFEDITERKRTLAELRACENILLFENLEVAGRYNSYVII